MVLGILSQTAARESVPKDALVGTVVPVDVGLDPCITSSWERGVAWLQGERVDEEVQVDNVAFRATVEDRQYRYEWRAGVESTYVGSVCAVVEKPCSLTSAA